MAVLQFWRAGGRAAAAAEMALLSGTSRWTAWLARFLIVRFMTGDSLIPGVM